MTQDWHVPGHLSFASSHAGRAPFETTLLSYGPQILWPDHCVQGSFGAELSSALSIPKAELIVRKGYRREIDSYSAFCEADGVTLTGLAGYLRERGFWETHGTGILPGLPWRASFGRVSGAAPELGADTDAVLREVLSLSRDEIAALRDLGAFG